MLRDLRAFALLSCGQLVSAFGSGLSRFALAVWLYQQTGSVTQYGLMLFFSSLPELLFSPIAGAFVDRWDRRVALILSDGGLAFSTLSVALLLAMGRLEIWHIYALSVLGSLFGAFQWPAYSASVTMLVPKRHLGRANGVTQLFGSASSVLAPVCAVALVDRIGIASVLLIDGATFFVAMTTVAVVRIPRPEAPSGELSEQRASAHKLLSEIRTGISFIVERPGLGQLLLFLGLINLCVGFHTALVPSLLLGFASNAALGTVAATSSAGMMAGSLVMTLSGGPRRKMIAILGFGWLYMMSLGAIGFRASVPLIAVATFVAFFNVPLINGCSQVIWQSKIPPGLQGRVFALRRMVAQATLPLSFLLAGPLADRLFNPLLNPGGPMADTLGPLFGTGTGRGTGLLYLTLGVLGVAATVRAFLSPRLRGIESELPDYTE